MRRAVVACLVVVLLAGGASWSSASEGFDELVQVAKSGVDEKALMEFVNSSPVVYALTVEEILYLNDLGLSSGTIKAIAAHGRDPGAAPVVAGDTVVDAPATNVETVLEEAGAEDATQDSMQDAVAEAATPDNDTPPARDVVQEMFAAPPAIAAPQTNAVDYTTFYEGLAPYGNWLEIDGQWCWQPTAVLVNPGWSPYCQSGRWLYSDVGWAWQSSYSWGWAPFHYGRWSHHPRHRWIWRPGRTWGPSWVCWRFSDQAVGWAPLPPETTWEIGVGLCFRGRPVPPDSDFGLGWTDYTFVPFGRFCEPRLGHHRFPRSRVEAIFRGSTGRGSRIVLQESRICNFGPPLDRITAFTHREIWPVRIVDQHIPPGDPIPRPWVSGSTVSFFRPQVAPTSRETPRQVVVRHEARESERREAVRNDEVFRANRSVWAVQAERARGRESRGPASAVVIQPDASRRESDAVRAVEQQRNILRLQRESEEAAALRRQEESRRARDLVQTRNAEVDRVREQARQQALAEQQHREAEFLRQQEERRRAEAVAQQQELQRQIQEAVRLRESQREAEPRVRALEAQRQALRAQREAEENAARAQRDTPAAVSQGGSYRWPQGTTQIYGDSSGTTAESRRGATSRARFWRDR